MEGGGGVGDALQRVSHCLREKCSEGLNSSKVCSMVYFLNYPRYRSNTQVFMSFIFSFQQACPENNCGVLSRILPSGGFQGKIPHLEHSALFMLEVEKGTQIHNSWFSQLKTSFARFKHYGVCSHFFMAASEHVFLRINWPSVTFRMYVTGMVVFRATRSLTCSGTLSTSAMPEPGSQSVVQSPNTVELWSS